MAIATSLALLRHGRGSRCHSEGFRPAAAAARAPALDLEDTRERYAGLAVAREHGQLIILRRQRDLAALVIELDLQRVILDADGISDRSADEVRGHARHEIGAALQYLNEGGHASPQIFTTLLRTGSEAGLGGRSIAVPTGRMAGSAAKPGLRSRIASTMPLFQLPSASRAIWSRRSPS